MAMRTTILRNGRFFLRNHDTKDDQSRFCDCIVVSDTTISHVGSWSDKEVQDAASELNSLTYDMNQRIVLPGLIDAHMHTLAFGQGLLKLDLSHCASLDDIKASIKNHAAANPNAPRIFCKSWMRHMSGGKALASMIDDVDPRPIYIDAKDLHSAWCNTAALREMGAETLADPPGGSIIRDAAGKPTGELSESAVMVLLWPHIAKMALREEKITALDLAFSTYLASGYTGLVDMAMDENAWAAIQLIRQRDGKLPVRMSAYWLVSPPPSQAEIQAQVRRAAELSAQHNASSTPDCRVVGIKLVCDGIIDACTAALLEPYSSNGSDPGPIWSPQQMAWAVQAADSAGLQIAMHAIGDRTVRNAIDALEQYATPGGRHRIEHLELTSKEDAARLGKLGITASIQAMHADPAILRAWTALLGHERCHRAFAYSDFHEGGATLALGTDAPTSPISPFWNLYTATTRRSAREVAYEKTVNPEFRLSLCTAVAAATAGAAQSTFSESWTGSIEVGKKADLTVWDTEWSETGILSGSVYQTWTDGLKVFERRD